jgi:hypothetical protein
MAPKNFSVLTSVSTSILAERLVSILVEADIDAFTRAGGAAGTDLFSAASPGFLDVLVQSDKLTEAQKLVQEELSALERDAELNSQAAEEESLSSENVVG